MFSCLNRWLGCGHRTRRRANGLSMKTFMRIRGAKTWTEVTPEAAVPANTGRAAVKSLFFPQAAGLEYNEPGVVGSLKPQFKAVSRGTGNGEPIPEGVALVESANQRAK